MLKVLISALAVAGAVQAQAQTVTYATDPAHTFVTFEINHFGTSTNRGRFDRKAGVVRLDRTARTGSVELRIETASVNTGTPAFDKTLRGKDFFNSANHPSVRFVATDFSFDGDKVSQVSGQLTLLGKTHPVTLRATQFGCYENRVLRREVCGGDFETVIQRSHWGLNWGIAFGFADNVRLLIQVEAIAQ